MPVITVSDGVSHLSGTAGQIELSDTGKCALAGGHDITLSLASPLVVSTIAPSSALVTAGSGSGVVVDDTGSVRQVVYKVETTYAAYSAAAKTGDVTLCTLPARSRLVAFYSDTKIAYTGGGETAATLKVGITAGGAGVLAVHDVFTAAVTKGLVDADMGTAMVRSALIQSAYTPSFTATTTIIARLTTTTNNTSALTAGNTIFYIITEVLP